jgi:RNA polymerase sigma-70 factor (ECF subfamily)
VKTDSVMNQVCTYEQAEKEQFFNSIYKEYWYKVYHYSYLYTGDKSEAEDLAQDLFLKLWQQFDRLNGVENVKGYLFIMARNNCHNHYKKELRRKPLYKNYCRSFDEACYHDEVVAKELNRIAIRAVQELPAKQRKVFIYRDMGLGRKEIADILNVSVNTIDACINIAMKKVQQYVSRELELSTAA